ncbi:uncharacterized protein C16orf96 homolog isoform X2 [Ahaetulla prasina]|uniref:uncharacterized protein C16orf96 homolog isoform X2 n=1 Tax=Ahaetulla prasina TaxID=499056 RepID=UPI0026487DBB|nr:uncharacterized protein C16orf96 homolog isoform X2 [Ahaetulla prasina]
MSRTLSFVELINLAIGTPELGNVNFNALHLFLHSLVEHLRLHDVRKEVSAEELEFIKPPPSSGASAATSATETLPAVQKSSSIFHQMQERITAIERQLRFLNEPPDTAELLARSQGMGQPALDMWQMMQLKKKLELNEEGMTKAMNTLQDLLNSICSLKIATEGFQQELGQLKKDVAQINGEEMKERLLCLDKQARMMEEMKEQLGLVKERVSLSASASKVVSWSALCETLTGKTFEEEEGGREKADSSRVEVDRGRVEEDRGREKPDGGRVEEDRGREKADGSRVEEDRGREKADGSRVEEDRGREKADGGRVEEDRGRVEEDRGREKTSREILAVLSQLPEKHEALLKHITQLEAQLKYPAGPAAFEMPPELKSLLEQMEILQTQSQQGKESLQETLEQMERLREQFENLQQGVERLSRSSTEMQIIRNLLHQLDIKKADKDSIQEEMNVKADKSALEAMVNHGQLQLATSQLSEMMQDLLQKMSLQDKDWQKALEKLFVDMDCKLDRLALDPVSRQLEEVWKFIKKYLSEGPRFDADSAAGFKKQLFERVKCISCDRPVTMMTGPHMITVRKAMLKPRPVSASGYEYLFHQQKRDQDPSEMSSNPPLQTCWQCQAQQQACALKHLSRTQDFATLYPYGDPTAITYDNTEVDILGVNGVLYKGRVSSHAAERTFALQKEFAALKIPRPPTGVRMERVRSAFADISAVPYPSSVLRRVGSAIANSNQRPQQLSCDPVDRTIISGTLSESHVQNERNVPGLSPVL